MRILLVVSLSPVLVVVGYLRSGQESVAVPVYTVEDIRGGSKEYTTVRRQWSEIGVFGFLRTEDDSVPWSDRQDEPKVGLVRHESWFDTRGVLLSLIAGGSLPCAVGLVHKVLVGRKTADPGGGLST